VETLNTYLSVLLRMEMRSSSGRERPTAPAQICRSVLASGVMDVPSLRRIALFDGEELNWDEITPEEAAHLARKITGDDTTVGTQRGHQPTRTTSARSSR
jgi:hypothetical protein